VLDPDVVLRLDRGAVPVGASRVVRGAPAVAGLGFSFSGAGWLAQSALVNGVPGLVVSRHGRPGSVVGFTLENNKIVGIDILADPARIRRLKLAELWNEAPS
jgi:RNA polymerase sigma-70 factor (ECF subfamily)